MSQLRNLARSLARSLILLPALLLALAAASASADPRRGARTLCIDAVAGQQVAWLQAGACTEAARAVPVRTRLPESDIVELLEQQATLLAGARLLFAGNTECARVRARAFKLAAIDVGAAVPGGETMAGLVFTGEHGAAIVWARRSGIEYTAWNVFCQRS